MGKAYTPQQREQVRGLLEAGRDEETIEKETGVSDRTIRRWKTDLERTGRIGKPSSARTGRHRVLSPEMETALIEYQKEHTDASVDEMLWWLWETHKIVVGTRTIRRVFERKGEVKFGRKSNASLEDLDSDDGSAPRQAPSPAQPEMQYQSPYAPMTSQATAAAAEQQLAQVLQQHSAQPLLPSTMDFNAAIPDDEETVELQLQQVLLEKREVELKLKLRQLKSGKVASPAMQKAPQQPTRTSTLYNPNAVIPNTPKRDSRSKKKIEESKKRTAERQERMLRDLERRSRRRDHLTAEWVLSKDIWPLRAQGMLANLMHQYGCYVFNQSHAEAFEAMFRTLHEALVDRETGDWVPHIHDDLLRERMKRKMGQLRTKMSKTGEIVGRADGYGGFQKVEGYSGEQAGDTVGDDSEMVSDIQAQSGAASMQEEAMHYQPVPEHHQDMQAPPGISYHPAMINPQGPPQYPMMEHQHPGFPYTQMSNQLTGQTDGMVM